MAGFDINKLGEWIKKVENQIAQSGGDVKQDGKINTAEENSVFAKMINDKVSAGEITEADANEIFGFVKSNAVTSPKIQTASTIKSTDNTYEINDGETAIFSININFVVKIDLTININLDELLEKQNEAIDKLMNMLTEYINDQQHKDEKFEDIINSFIVQVINLITNGIKDGKIDFQGLEEILKVIADRLEELNCKIDNLTEVVLEKMDSMLAFYKSTNVNLEAIKGLLENINANDEEEIKMLDSIMKLLAIINSTQNEQKKELADLLNNILDKLSTMDKSIQEGFANIIVELIEQGASLEDIKAILGQIEKDTSNNGEVTMQILKILTLIKEELASLSDDAKDVKSGMLAIVNQLVEQGASLDDIKKLLAEIKADTSEGNKISLQILDAIKLIQTELVGLSNEVKNGVTNIIAEIVKQGASMDDIKKLLAEIKKDTSENNETSKLILSAINELGGDISAQLTNILATINVGGGSSNNEPIINLLKEILEQIKKNGDENKDGFKAMIDAISGLGNDMKEQAQLILDAIKLVQTELAGLSSEVKNGVTNIIGELVKQGANVDDIKQLLEEIKADTSKNNEISLLILNTIKELGGDVSAQLTNILAAINEGGGTPDNTEVINLLKEILDQIKKNGDDNKEGFKSVIDAIATLGSDVAGQITNILKAIDEQKENSEAIKVILNQILTQAQENGADNKEGFKAILEAIANIPSGAPVDIGQMETLLKQIKELLQNNNDKLDEVITNENTIIMILNSFKKEVMDYLAEFGAEGEAIKERIDKLIEKLENGQCNCDVDGAALMDMLQKILDAIKNHKCECDCGNTSGGNNEGILDDASQILGAPKRDNTGIGTVEYNGKSYKVGDKLLKGNIIVVVGQDGLYDTSGRLVEKF